ncbi:MAG: NACHT domain-containing protein [Simkania sp.]|nr:NACHT domain-containing protein [Simkania sp.]
MLRQAFDDLHEKNLTGIIKNFYERFQKFLEEKFTKELCQIYSKNNEIRLLIGEKTLPIESLYARLAIIGQSERGNLGVMLRSQKIEDGRPVTHETLFEAKQPIALEKLFEHLDHKKRATVYGSAGIGKSTLCHYISYLWAQQKLWPQFKMIFWIKFRNLTEKRYPEDRDFKVSDVLIRECDFRSEEYKSLLNKKEFRDQCLLFLDGYDEFSYHTLELKSAEGNSFKALEAFQRDFDHVLVTTRPQKIEGFQEVSEIEIIGFDQEGISKYVQNFFSIDKEVDSPEEVKKKSNGRHAFEVQFNNPLIRSLCHIPINLEIFCSLAYEGEAFSADHITTTIIYDKLTDWLIRRFFREKTSKNLVDILAPRPKNKKEIIGAMKSLEELAWKALDQNQLYLENTEDNPKITEIFKENDVEITDVTKIGPFRIDNEEGHFIHLTFQEFFAAQYLARVFRKVCAEEGKNIVVCKKFYPRYSLVMSMTAGILSKENCDQDALQNYFNCLCSPKSADLVLLAQCFEECTKESRISQYEDFIKTCQGFIKDVVSEEEDSPEKDRLVHLIHGHPKLLHHPEIVRTIAQIIQSQSEPYGMGHAMRETLYKIADKADKIPHEIIMASINSLKKGDLYAAYIIERHVSYGYELPEGLLDALLQILKKFKNDSIRLTTIILRGIERKGHDLPEEVVPLLIDILRSVSNEEILDPTAAVLSSLLIKGTTNAKKILEEIFQILKYSDSRVCKKFAAMVLKSAVQHTTNFANETLEKLVQASKNIQEEYDTKIVVATVLREIAEGSTQYAEEALNCLINTMHTNKACLRELQNMPCTSLVTIKEEIIGILKNPECDPEFKGIACLTIKKLIIEDEFVSHEGVIIEGLTQLLKEPDYRPKGSAIAALKEIAKKKNTLPKETLEELEKITTMNPKEDPFDYISFAGSVLRECGV